MDEIYMEFHEFALSDKPEEREKRESKARSAECTPLNIFTESQNGVFSGTSGEYTTWVGECECVDFRRRGFPCKHMYRLAHELGIYDLGEVNANLEKVKRKITPRERAEAYEKSVSLIETYSEETQKELQSVLSDRYRNMMHICADISSLKKPLSDGLLEIVDSPITIVERHTQKQTVEGMLTAGFTFPSEIKTTKKARYEWCIAHPDIACSHVYPQHCVVRPTGTLEIANKKTYTYLNQKFPTEFSDYW